jgi:hypothetical protein
MCGQEDTVYGRKVTISEANNTLTKALQWVKDRGGRMLSYPTVEVGQFLYWRSCACTPSTPNGQFGFQTYEWK